jgi:hypothetical protein
MMKRRKTAVIHPRKMLAETRMLGFADDHTGYRLSPIKGT